MQRVSLNNNFFFFVADAVTTRRRDAVRLLRTDREIEAALDQPFVSDDEEADLISMTGSLGDISQCVADKMPTGNNPNK